MKTVLTHYCPWITTGVLDGLMGCIEEFGNETL